MGIKDMKDEIAAKIKELHTAYTVERAQVGAAYTLFTGETLSELSAEQAQEVATMTSGLKESVDDIETSVQESQQP